MAQFLSAIIVFSGLVAPAQQLRYSHAARIYLEDTDHEGELSGPLPIPENIEIPAAQQELVREMLRRSPTFRAQCSRIAAASHLHVVVQRTLAAPAADGAITEIALRPDGRVEADVGLGVLGDPILLIAHEFEHILEQLDGVDLPAMAARDGTGVSSSSGHFETQRAIAAGRLVAREVSRVVARR